MRGLKMVPHLLHVGIILSLSRPPIQASNITSPNYIGAVVEYHPVTDGDDGQMVAEANANNYRTIIKDASAYKVDIIVFPEFGLTSLPRSEKGGDKQFNATGYRDYYYNTASYIPSPNETIVLCDMDSNKYAKSLQSISCAAREYNMYVVVNHHERADCPKKNCAPDDFLLYNTNVAFDRQGRVVARYRKQHLFNEPGTNVTELPEHSTFETDFGVTFGQFICFDILHEQPATFFAKNPNVTDVLYSTHWFNELPFLDSVQQQAAWSNAADVNFLASGYSEALTASGGSGIYAGKMGPIKIYQPRMSSNALIVAEIPKLDRRKRIEDIQAGHSFVHVFKQAEVPTISGYSSAKSNGSESFFKDDLRPYTTVLLEPSQGYSHITTLCDRGVCCDFHVETSYDKKLADKPGAKQYRYRLAVFNGVRNAGNVSTLGIEVCAVVSCAGDAIEDCGRLYPKITDVVAPTSFDSLFITRRTNLTNRLFYEPSTLTSELLPMNGNDFAFLTSGQANSSLMVMYLIRSKNDLTTFGIFGRNFANDGRNETKPNSSSARLQFSVALAISAVIFTLTY